MRQQDQNGSVCRSACTVAAAAASLRHCILGADKITSAKGAARETEATANEAEEPRVEEGHLEIA